MTGKLDAAADTTPRPKYSMVVSLGPLSTVVNGIKRNPQANGLASNPRCLRRDVNVNSALGARANYSYSLVMDYPKINNFYDRYLGQPFLQNDNHPWGVSPLSLLGIWQS